MLSLYDLCADGGDDAKLAQQFAGQWHGSDWAVAEDHWEQLVSRVLQTRDMQRYTPRAALRVSERIALDILKVYLPHQRSTCPICRHLIDQRLPRAEREA
ncbi:hypothetical protein ABIE67_006272 [Streptomyces sp. V4I8]|uniref:DUF6313 family protein n=1 Tax=Streptomyces sp. V4I8 TaxID=3156469 RepID=UPI003512A0A2